MTSKKRTIEVKKVVSLSLTRLGPIYSVCMQAHVGMNFDGIWCAVTTGHQKCHGV